MYGNQKNKLSKNTVKGHSYFTVLLINLIVTLLISNLKCTKLQTNAETNYALTFVQFFHEFSILSADYHLNF